MDLNNCAAACNATSSGSSRGGGSGSSRVYCIIVVVCLRVCLPSYAHMYATFCYCYASSLSHILSLSHSLSAFVAQIKNDLDASKLSSLWISFCISAGVLFNCLIFANTHTRTHIHTCLHTCSTHVPSCNQALCALLLQFASCNFMPPSAILTSCCSHSLPLSLFLSNPSLIFLSISLNYSCLSLSVNCVCKQKCLWASTKRLTKC